MQLRTGAEQDRDQVTPTARAMSRIELGPSATIARATGLNRGR